MLKQILSLLGAALILIGYVGNQRGTMRPSDVSYNLVNLFGALFLLWVAVLDWSWGFIVLETVWAGIAIPPLLRRLRAG